MAITHQPAHRRPTLRTTARSRQERGYVLVMFSLLLVPLLLMAGFSIDVGSWYNRASDMRKAADAAALAGVVWLPDQVKARSVALDVAARNGFVPDSHVSITVTPSTQSSRRLKVTIADDRVGSFFYEHLGGSTIELNRTSFAEYVLPVPLGSPRNYFGTGRLLQNYTATGIEPELLYQSVNPWCTDKVNGDRYQSGYFGDTCGGTPNTEKNNDGYDLYIEAPEGRTSPIEVRLYDPRYNDDCLTNYWNGSNWTRANGSTNSPGYDTYNPARTQSGPGLRYWNGSSWIELHTTAQSGTSTFWQTAQVKTCANSNGTPYYDAAPDSFRQSGKESYTFTLFDATQTPLNDTDITPVAGCSKVFTNTTPFDGYTYLGSVRWNTLCTIGVGASSGRYVLRVHNSNGVSSPEADGSNQWGLVAKYTSTAEASSLCDGRNDNVCPRVYGKNAISVYANTSAAAASFYLAEIAPEHKGKKLQLELWDPGEGGKQIEIQQPTGTNTWASVPITWESFTNAGAADLNGSGTAIDVTNSRFNGKLLKITVDLGSYTPPADNNWWKIKYTFTSGSVTDRTTWSAKIVGDPVHLVEEY